MSAQGQRLDLVGQRFGRLTCLGYVSQAKDHGSGWLCRCDCGKEAVAKTHSLKSGNTRSCGCLAADVLRSRSTIHGDAARSNGHRRPRLYGIWARMRQRCSDPRSSDFDCYGGRGVRVCDEWRDFAVFRAWAMANGYRDDLSIDRRDNDGNYEPGNCEWIALGRQARNKRNNHVVSYRGAERALAEWGEVLGIDARTLNTLRMRLRAGWPVERAFTTPVRGRPVAQLEVAADD